MQKKQPKPKLRRPPKPIKKIGEMPENVPELPDDAASRHDVPEGGERPAAPDEGRRSPEGTDADRGDGVGSGDVERGPSS